MSSPIPGSTPSTPLIFPSSNDVQTTSIPSQPDTISLGQGAVFAPLLSNAEHPELNPPKISLAEFFDAINEAINNLKQIQNFGDMTDPLVTRNLGISLIQNAAELLALMQKYSKAGDDYNFLVQKQKNDIDKINQTISDFEIEMTNAQTEDNNQVAIMNQAIQDYNNGDITLAEFETIANAYNDYISGRNESIFEYNAAILEFINEVNENNALIAQLNEVRESLGITPPIPLQPVPDLQTAELLPLQTLPPPATPLPFITLPSPVSYPLVTDFPTDAPPTNDVLKQFFNPIFENYMKTYEMITRGQQLRNELLNFLKFILPNLRNPYVAANFISTIPQPLSTTQAGSGVGLGTMLTNLLPRAQAIAVNRALVAALARAANLIIPPHLYDQLHLSLLDLLSKTGLRSVLPSLGILADRFGSLGPDSQAMKTALSLVFISNLNSLVGSRATELAVADLIRSHFGKDVTGTDELARGLAAAFNLSILSYGLTEVAIQLGLPGLTPQLLANVSGLSLRDATLVAEGGSRFGNLLQNPLNVAGTINNLANSLSISRNEIEQIFTRGIGKLSPFSTASQIRDALENEFRLAGYNSLASRTFANRSLNFLQGEGIPYLDTRFNLEGVNSELLTTSLRENLKGFVPDPDATVSQTIVGQLNLANFETKREFRDRLVNDLTTAGVGQLNAINLANLETQILETGRAPEAIPTEAIQRPLLETSLTSLGINNVQAADVVNRTLLQGPFTSEAQLRTTLEQALQNAGVAGATAADIASSALIKTVSPGVSPLTSVGLTPVLTPDAIGNELRNELVNKLKPEIGEALAVDLANRLAIGLVGAGRDINLEAARDRANPTSVLRRYDEQLEILKGLNRREIDREVESGLRPFIRPNYELYEQTGTIELYRQLISLFNEGTSTTVPKLPTPVRALEVLV